MFKKILFATTATSTCDNAAHVAFDLAKKYTSELSVLHIFGRPSRGFSTIVTDARTGEDGHADDDYVAWVREEMNQYYEKQMGECGTCEMDARVGVPHTEILRTARKKDTDLIVMGAHSRQEEPGATRYRSVVGSTMQKVAKSARCPVLIVSRPCTTCLWYFSNIIFGTDFTKASDSAFKFAFKLCQEIGSKLYLFHALDLSATQSGTILEQTEIEGMIKAARKKIEQRYVSQMGDFDNYEIEIWEGIPYVEILKYSREKNGDLIVMSHHTREIDPEKALLGSTVEQVVLRASCPVASVNRPHKVSDDE
ncbi:universal stress protein [Desulfonema ishimotonii]|uniref:Universal stress protein n=1 Tax=Desulfonema ishimotonii TaxID=45657 RepID=A0A401FZD3_9BACT|nr:universal stress protein [Desulfonema ishimotonii]GBC62318.1 universal stress protein [Desulfonema ishimotonii]